MAASGGPYARSRAKDGLRGGGGLDDGDDRLEGLPNTSTIPTYNHQARPPPRFLPPRTALMAAIAALVLATGAANVALFSGNSFIPFINHSVVYIDFRRTTDAQDANAITSASLTLWGFCVFSASSTSCVKLGLSNILSTGLSFTLPKLPPPAAAAATDQQTDPIGTLLQSLPVRALPLALLGTLIATPPLYVAPLFNWLAIAWRGGRGSRNMAKTILSSIGAFLSFVAVAGLSVSLAALIKMGMQLSDQVNSAAAAGYGVAASINVSLPTVTCAALAAAFVGFTLTLRAAVMARYVRNEDEDYEDDDYDGDPFTGFGPSGGVGAASAAAGGGGTAALGYGMTKSAGDDDDAAFDAPFKNGGRLPPGYRAPTPTGSMMSSSTRNGPMAGTLLSSSPSGGGGATAWQQQQRGYPTQTASTTTSAYSGDFARSHPPPSSRSSSSARSTAYYGGSDGRPGSAAPLLSPQSRPGSSAGMYGNSAVAMMAYPSSAVASDSMRSASRGGYGGGGAGGGGRGSVGGSSAYGGYGGGGGAPYGTTGRSESGGYSASQRFGSSGYGGGDGGGDGGRGGGGGVGSEYYGGHARAQGQPYYSNSQ